MKIENYYLEKLIGKGDFCEVYFTTKKDDQKKYATKVYNRAFIDENQELTRYLRKEVMIVKNLYHPNIIKLHDRKKSKNHYYIIYEYCNGGRLSEALEKYMEKYGKPFPEEIIQYLMRQIINVYQYIRVESILHRLAFLDNLLLNYENEEDAKNLNLMKSQIKIKNFLLAEYLPENIEYSSFIELSEYNGCENPSILKQLDKKITKAKRLNFYDKNNDIWSIGCICYEMLMGISLLNEGKMEKILQKIKNGNYTIPMTISYEIISFINGMLDKKKDERLNYYGLIKHDFFTKDVNEFKKMELRLSEKIFSGTFNIDDLSTGSIWRIFNEKDDALLSSILGSVHIIFPEKDKNSEIFFEKEKESTSK